MPHASTFPPQGRLVQVLARLAGASRILEIGALAGYSTIGLAHVAVSRG